MLPVLLLHLPAVNSKFKNFQRKIPKINNLKVLTCASFWVVGWNLDPLCPACALNHPSSRVSTLCTLPVHLSLSSVLVIRLAAEVKLLVFKSPLFYLTTAPKCKSSDAGNLDMPKRSQKSIRMYRKKQCIQGSVLCMVPGIHSGSWNVSSGGAGGGTVL